MRKSILVLEESHIVHELFESALPEGKWVWDIHHESSPDKYLRMVRSLKPDVIFLSNQDQKRGYPVVKGLHKNTELSKIPLILLTIARDQLNEAFLEAKGVAGFIRKPFESTVLQDQLEAVLDQNNSGQNYNPALDEIDVIDDELRDLMSDSSGKDRFSLDSLENELDPTIQLEPVDNQLIEPTENEDFDLPDEDGYKEEQELVSGPEFDDFSEDEEIIVTEDTDVSPLNDEEKYEIFASDDSIDYDLEEESGTSSKKTGTDNYEKYQIAIAFDSSLCNPNPLLNEANDEGFIGITELKIRLFDSNEPSAVAMSELETDAMEQYESADLEEGGEDEYLEPDDYDDSLDSFEAKENELDEVYENDLNDIEAFESDMDIPDDLDDSEYAVDDSELSTEDDNPLISGFEEEDDILELQIDEFEEDQEDEEALYDNDDVTLDSDEPADYLFTEDEDEDNSLLEPEEVSNLDVDFEDNQTLLPEIENDLPDDARFETEESSESNVESQQNLQQMINFRHVSKAQYDVNSEKFEDVTDQDDLEISAELMENADEVSIEVSSDVFEMDDFNIDNVIDDNDIIDSDEEEIGGFKDENSSDTTTIPDPLEGADLEDEILEIDQPEEFIDSEEEIFESDQYSDTGEALDLEDDDEFDLSDDLDSNDAINEPASLVDASDEITEDTEFSDPEPLEDFESDNSMGAALDSEDNDFEEDSSIIDQSIENEPEPEADIFEEFTEVEILDQNLLENDVEVESTNDDSQENQQFDEIELSDDVANGETLSLDDENESLFEGDSSDDEVSEMETDSFDDSEDLTDETSELSDEQGEETNEEVDDLFDDQEDVEVTDETDDLFDDQEDVEVTDKVDHQGDENISDSLNEEETIEQNTPEIKMDAFDLLKQEVIVSQEDDLFDDSIDKEDENKDDLDLIINTEILNGQEEFLDYPDEDSIIGAENAEPVKATADQEKIVPSLKERVTDNLPQNITSELSEMIEGVITETIQKTLSETLPELMEKIIQEELENS